MCKCLRLFASEADPSYKHFMWVVGPGSTGREQGSETGKRKRPVLGTVKSWFEGWAHPLLKPLGTENPPPE